MKCSNDVILTVSSAEDISMGRRTAAFCAFGTGGEPCTQRAASLILSPSVICAVYAFRACLEPRASQLLHPRPGVKKHKPCQKWPVSTSSESKQILDCGRSSEDEARVPMPIDAQMYQDGQGPSERPAAVTEADDAAMARVLQVLSMD